MKIKLFLFFFIYLSAVSGKVYSQNYKPFPNSNAYWIENRSQYYCCPNAYRSWNYQNMIAGDTIANGYTYQLISSTGYFNYWTDFYTICSNCFFTYTIGAYRQDTINRKVYSLDLNTGNDTLLYDFNLSIGDTLPQTFTNYNYPYTTISNIDSILLADGYHRRLVLNFSTFTDSASIIEGIGSIMGLFEPIIAPFEASSELNCFSYSNIPIYPDTATQCNLVVNVIEVPSAENFFSIFPNPAADIIHIQNNFASPMEVTVFSAYGNVVHKTTFAKGADGSIDLSGWVNGIYLVTVQSDKNFVSKKIVKH